MKNFKNLFLLILAALLIMSANAFAQDATIASANNTSSLDGIIAFISDNWGVVIGVLFGISELLSLIPALKSNGVFQLFFYTITAAKNKIKK